MWGYYEMKFKKYIGIAERIGWTGILFFKTLT